MADSLPVLEAESRSPTPLWYSGLYALGANLLLVVLRFASSILIARALGPANKGSYDLALTTTALLAMGLGLSLQSGITYTVARGRTAVGSLVPRLVVLALVQGILTVLLLAVIRGTHYWTVFLPPENRAQSVAVIAVALVFTQLITYWRAVLIGRQKIVLVNTVDVVSQAVFMALLVIGILGLMGRNQEPAAMLFVWLYTIGVAISSLLFLGALRPFSTGPLAFREIAGYSFPCYLGNLTQFLSFRVDVFLVSFFLGVEAVGLYALAVSLSQLIWLISQAAAMVLWPRVAARQDARTENAALTAQVSRIVLWASVILVPLFGLAGGYLIPVVYGEAFGQSVAPFLWLLPGTIAVSALNVLASYLAGIGKPRLNLYVALAGLAVIAGLDVLLIPRFGISGAALASTGAALVSAALTIGIFRRLSGTSLRDTLALRRADIDMARSIWRRAVGRPAG